MEELLFAEEDRKAVEFIQKYLPQDIKEKFTEDDIYYMLDAFAEYCEDAGLIDNEGEETEVDIDEAAASWSSSPRKTRSDSSKPKTYAG